MKKAEHIELQHAKDVRGYDLVNTHVQESIAGFGVISAACDGQTDRQTDRTAPAMRSASTMGCRA